MKKLQSLTRLKATELTVPELKKITGGYYYCRFYSMSNGSPWDWYCGQDIDTCLRLMSEMDDFGGGACM